MRAYGIEVNKSNIQNNLLNVRNSIGFSNAICPDQYVADIYYNNNSFSLVNNNILTRCNVTRQANQSFSYDIDYSSIKGKCNYIIFILESPHIDEFNLKTKLPYGPACGSTGRNINNYIINVLNNSLRLKSALKSKSYKLILVNAVQYQTSCGIQPINKKIRDKNWIDFWKKGFARDLICRLNSFIALSNECHIVNLCTYGDSGLHFYVNEVLHATNTPFYEGYHPSCNWLNPNRQFIK